jgi:hypothetical protein
MSVCKASWFCGVLMVAASAFAQEKVPFEDEPQAAGVAEAAASATPAPPSRCGDCTGVAACSVGCPSACGAGGRFYVIAEGQFLKLDRPSDRVLIVANRATYPVRTDGEPVLNTGDMSFDTEAGPRLTLGYYLSPCSAVEVTYFGLHNWNTSAEVTGDDNLSLPGDAAFAARADFFDVSRMQVFYGATLNNAELNYYRRVGCTNFSVLAGLRYIRFNESLDIRGSGAENSASDYLIDAKNNMFGPQLGARWRKQWCRFGIEAVDKIGLLGNSAQQHTLLADNNNTVLLRDTAHYVSHAAFVNELNLTATVCLLKNLHARAGYSFLWIDGIARAPDQLDFTDTTDSSTGLVSNKSAFLHGANLGIEYRR